jgi:predicted nucleic acid-binding protein
MGDSERPGSAREEAERLVAAGLAALSSGRLPGGLSGSLGSLGGALLGAAGGAGHGSFATGSPECCVCPICRVMSALRDPSPEVAERLATGVGDLAAGVASLMRSLAEAASESSRATTEPDDERVDRDTDTDPDEVWRTATRTSDDSGPTADHDVWAAATAVPEPRPPVKPMARKVVKPAASPEE